MILCMLQRKQFHGSSQLQSRNFTIFKDYCDFRSFLFFKPFIQVIINTDESFSGWLYV